MTDLYDQAQEREQRDREAAIAAARQPVHGLPDATGVCLNCGDDMAAAEEAEQAIAARWCSVECRDDWISRTGRRAR